MPTNIFTAQLPFSDCTYREPLQCPFGSSNWFRPFVDLPLFHKHEWIIVLRNCGQEKSEGVACAFHWSSSPIPGPWKPLSCAVWGNKSILRPLNLQMNFPETFFFFYEEFFLLCYQQAVLFYSNKKRALTKWPCNSNTSYEWRGSSTAAVSVLSSPPLWVAV